MTIGMVSTLRGGCHERVTQIKDRLTDRWIYSMGYKEGIYSSFNVDLFSPKTEDNLAFKEQNVKI